jgi:hypothetical protein
MKSMGLKCQFTIGIQMPIHINWFKSHNCNPSCKQKESKNNIKRELLTTNSPPKKQAYLHFVGEAMAWREGRKQNRRKKNQ